MLNSGMNVGALKRMMFFPILFVCVQAHGNRDSVREISYPVSKPGTMVATIDGKPIVLDSAFYLNWSEETLHDPAPPTYLPELVIEGYAPGREIRFNIVGRREAPAEYQLTRPSTYKQKTAEYWHWRAGSDLRFYTLNTPGDRLILDEYDTINKTISGRFFFFGARYREYNYACDIMRDSTGRFDSLIGSFSKLPLRLH
jgi:hypothetical protein